MPDLHMERDFPLSPEALFAWVTDPVKLLSWWGPEGIYVSGSAPDFTRVGPWQSVMTNGVDLTVQVSGHVTHVTPPKSVGLTWAWHDVDGRRGQESHVTFTVEPAPCGARLILDHRDLTDDDSAADHKRGWISTFAKLGKIIMGP
ncbi:SRPBCC family protein [Chachezhania sediminis]|uniref:SRPBCC family protein n=1 Tax=Chachezhania sediminis TaxID=2599291 RepID=UPI00131C9FD2|nr:SRPBCC domain-containing protein [Chachezhania sediminis]